MGVQSTPPPVIADNPSPESWVSLAPAPVSSPTTQEQEPYFPMLQESRPADLPSLQTPGQPNRQPIEDAVNTALNQTPSTHQLDPDFLRQLTEHVTDEVIRNIQAIKLPSLPTPVTSPRLASARRPVNWPVPSRSPCQSSTDSFPRQFTPPSPEQDRYEREASPEPMSPNDAGSSYSRESHASRNSFVGMQNDEEQHTPRASEHGAIPNLRRSRMTPVDKGAPVPTEPRRRSGVRIATEDNDFEPPGLNQGAQTRSRQTSDASDIPATTTLEKIWKPLFVNGIPTARLSQFLRGLAKHIIDEYEPRGTLVITPSKMSRFLAVTRTSNDRYPWSTIFGGQVTSNSIATMYRKLLCQHHFVQSRDYEAPTIPSLTPSGFEAFMTCLIQAHPDTEFERLAEAVREMPISNADNHRDRFPKELPRSLLPAMPDITAEQRIISSLAHEPTLVPLERRMSTMPPPPASAPPPQSIPVERERNPYSRTSQDSSAITDEDSFPPCSVPERERMPYHAREGTGKIYNMDDDLERRHDSEGRDGRTTYATKEPGRPAASRYRSERPEYQTRPPPRRNSAAPPPSMYNQNLPTDPVPISPRNRRRMSSGPPPPGPPLGSSAFPQGRRRSRSPPSNRSFARSEPVDVNRIPPAQYASNMHPGQVRDRNSVDVDRDASRYTTRRPSERSYDHPNDDDRNGRPIPSRNGPMGPSGYPGSGFVGSPPMASRPRSIGTDNRSGSWHRGMGLGTNPGGTDGYGSGLYGSSAHN